ncbi:MAG: glucokinase, partial [Acidobacteriota bacterium]
MILAGDIGGTKTQLGLFESGIPIRPIRKAIFPSQSYNGLDEIIREFIPGLVDPLDAACFGVAGPIVNGDCITTNLPWNVRSASIAALLGLKSTRLLNDLEAFGYGIPLLAPDEFCTLNDGEAQSGNAGIIAAGTGLGEASMIWDGRRHIPSASEGGHVDFAPRNELEIELLRFMLKQFERVSIERLVSGPGLVYIYDFLLSAGYGKESAAISQKSLEQDASSVISAAALAEEDELSMRALDLFVSLYGATAGNLALT